MVARRMKVSRPKADQGSLTRHVLPPRTIVLPGRTGDAAEIQSSTTHDVVYAKLRERILFGGFMPGRSVTLRGLAEELGVSAMPVRDAVRRLTAERALLVKDNRRVCVPEMTLQRFEQIIFARHALEPEIAARALPNMTKQTIRDAEAIDATLDRAMARGEVENYMRANYRFHFSIYALAQADTLMPMVDSIWLQFGPFMRMAYGRLGTSKLEDFHRAAIAAMKRNDAAGLRAAIRADIGQGMRFIGEEVLSDTAGGAAPAHGLLPATSPGS